MIRDWYILRYGSCGKTQWLTYISLSLLLLQPNYRKVANRFDAPAGAMGPPAPQRSSPRSCSPPMLLG